VRPVHLPARSPNLNAYAKWFVRSVKSECLSQLVLLGEQHLRRALEEYVAHYHLERAHQGLGKGLIDGWAESSVITVERLPDESDKYWNRTACAGWDCAVAEMAPA
jgi:transposase InsO family protein